MGVDVGASLQEQLDNLKMRFVGGVMKWRERNVVESVWIVALREQRFDGWDVALGGRVVEVIVRRIHWERASSLTTQLRHSRPLASDLPTEAFNGCCLERLVGPRKSHDRVLLQKTAMTTATRTTQSAPVTLTPLVLGIVTLPL